MEKKDAESESKENRINWMEFNKFEIEKSDDSAPLGRGCFSRNNDRKNSVYNNK